ncbi:YceD family protein [Deinococcus sp. KNUC1210]|uniref:YceD family protein n=1 Tax=Deinococcus sp. KNUC1210 TaxID=2917691 RepID=UPI001EEFEEC6|nr:YceD family protein [Deinococcus sp. KNUC1210]ULH14343.1 YceD family protein [Deinococcus sp. KNUC1210]
MNDDTPRIHLGSLLRGSGDASVSGEVQELHYEQAGRPQTLRFAVPAPYGIDVNPLEGNELWLQGYFEPTLDQECSRCLKPVTVPLDLKLGTLMQYRPAVQEPFLEEADSGEELLVFGNPDLDLSSYLAEMALLSAPLSVLHDPDCKGLCQVCGHDLNEGPCEHSAAVPIEQEHATELGVPEGSQHAHQNPFAALQGLNLPDE